MDALTRVMLPPTVWLPLFAWNVVPGCVWTSFSPLTKKNSLLRMIGPPRLKPMSLNLNVPGLNLFGPACVPTYWLLRKL